MYNWDKIVAVEQKGSTHRVGKGLSGLRQGVFSDKIIYGLNIGMKAVEYWVFCGGAR